MEAKTIQDLIGQARELHSDGIVIHTELAELSFKAGGQAMLVEVVKWIEKNKSARSLWFEVWDIDWQTFLKSHLSEEQIKELENSLKKKE